MFHSQVSSKGQVVIPKPLRDRWGISEGAVVAFAEDANGLRLEVQPKHSRKDVLASLQAGLGLTGYQGPALSTEAMREGVKKALGRRKA